jgi:Methyltransferase FkbM domain
MTNLLTHHSSGDDSFPVIDYLSLDCEGAETLVLHDFPFDRYQFTIMTIERPDSTLIETLEVHGYRQLQRLKQWGETLWAHDSALLIDRLDLSALSAIDTLHYKYSEKM